MKKKSIIKVIYICIAISIIINNKVELGNSSQKLNELQTTNVIISEKSKEMINDTINVVANGEDCSTNENYSNFNNQNEFDEKKLESDAIINQENIAYNGDNFKNGEELLGEYQGLTYYSQADLRWANEMYSSVNDTKQTMKSSACGPTSAAMVVSSSKGTILPTTMAQLFMDNGYRTADNGTSWGAFDFVSDFFNFNEYYKVFSLDEALKYLEQKDENGNSKYYIICSCANGLFTRNGHYIMLSSFDGKIIQIYDPYIYSGKFETTSRKNANVVVSGNTVFVSKEKFKEYANYKNFWIYSNDKGCNNQEDKRQILKCKKYVATKDSNLNIRMLPDINSNIIGSISKGEEVSVVEISGNWSKIENPNGWVNTSYLSSTKVNEEIYSKGRYIVKNISKGSYLNVRDKPTENSSIKTYDMLNQNAIFQNTILGNRYCNGYMKGVICDVVEIDDNWGKTKSGWICLKYCEKLKK